MLFSKCIPKSELNSRGIYHYLLIAILTFGISGIISAQTKKTNKLPKALREISGLTFLNDSVLVGHNDGGHPPELFLINLSGEVFHKVEIINATNIDWEDVAFDGKRTLYIGDFGNNENKRKDLCIYKIDTDSILEKNKVEAHKIAFHYPEQSSFPPPQEQRHFDAEALVYYRDSLLIFTKCNTKPFDGISYVYQLPTIPGIHIAQKVDAVYIGKKGYFQDAITGADRQGDTCFLLTYTKVFSYDLESRKLKEKRLKRFKRLSQKESIAIQSKGTIFVADERKAFLGGGKLYRIKLKVKK